MSVTDTGKGIDPAKRGKLFDRFEKVNEFDQGFGLGLAISKHLAVKLGGDIYFDETYQTGTRIFLTQPIKRNK
jgi:signal transduction histidine kinase